MEIEYEMTVEDVIAFNLFHTSQSPSLKRQVFLARLLAALFICGAVILLNNLLLPHAGMAAVNYGIAVLGGLFYYIIYPHTHRSGIARRIKKMYSEGDNKAIFGRQIITFSPEGILDKSPASESKFYWSSIVKVAQNEKYLFIYISSTNAIVIPRSAFLSNGLLNEALAYIAAQREQSQKGV